MKKNRTAAPKKAKEIAKLLRGEQPVEIYSRLSIGEAQEVYDQVMGRFPV